jgi:hypothetical protein
MAPRFPAHRRRIAKDDLRRAVRRAIEHNQDLRVCHGYALLKHLGDSLLDEASVTAHVDQNADEWLRRGLSDPLTCRGRARHNLSNPYSSWHPSEIEPSIQKESTKNLAESRAFSK